MVKQALLLALAHILSLVVRRKICAINICIQLATAQAAEHPFQSPGGAPPPPSPFPTQNSLELSTHLPAALSVDNGPLGRMGKDAGCRMQDSEEEGAAAWQWCVLWLQLCEGSWAPI